MAVALGGCPGDDEAESSPYVGCDEREEGPSEPGSPRIVSAAPQGADFDSATVRIQLSEGVAAVESIDSASFRLTFAHVVNADAGGVETEYWDPLVDACSNSDAWCGLFVELEQPRCLADDSTSFALSIRFWPVGMCNLLQFYNDNGIPSALLLHHQATGQADVTDQDGEPLEPMGAHVFTDPVVTVQPGDFRDTPHIEFECPAPDE